MTTFGSWLDSYDGPDNVVAGVASIWRTAKADEDTRPRASATETVLAWLAEHRGVAPEAQRAASRAYTESQRAGRALSPAEAAAFTAANAQQAAQPADGAQLPAWPAEPQPGQPEEAPGLPALATMLGAMMGEIRGKLDALRLLMLTQGQRLEAIEAWTAAQDERIAPVTQLLAELAQAEQAADDEETSPGHYASPEQARAAFEAGHAIAADQPLAAPPGQPQGGLWGNRAAPPDWAALHDLGDPEAAE